MPTPEPEPRGSAVYTDFVCPQCGPGVASDEDGCCVTCGATLVSDAARSLLASGAGAEMRERCAEIAEAYLHAETDDSSAPDRLDQIARYSNATVRRIAARIRALPEAAGACPACKGERWINSADGLTSSPCARCDAPPADSLSVDGAAGAEDGGS